MTQILSNTFILFLSVFDVVNTSLSTISFTYLVLQQLPALVSREKKKKKKESEQTKKFGTQTKGLL